MVRAFVHGGGAGQPGVRRGGHLGLAGVAGAGAADVVGRAGSRHRPSGGAGGRTVVAIQCKCYAEDAAIGKLHIDSFLNESARPAFGPRWIEAASASTRRSTAAPDGLIAATARIHGLPVMTRNVNDFLPAGVRVVNPWPR